MMSGVLESLLLAFLSAALSGAEDSGSLEGTALAGRRGVAPELRPLGGTAVAGISDHVKSNESPLAAKSEVKPDKDLQERQALDIFRNDIKELYRRGFSRQRRYSSKRLVLELPLVGNSTGQPPANESAGDPTPARGRYDVDLSTLPYVPLQPYIKALYRDMDNRLTLCVSVAYEEQVAFTWFLNGRIFDEYDTTQTFDFGTFREGNRTYRRRVCLREILHLLSLPTKTGRYEFNCTVTVDSKEVQVADVLTLSLIDNCPPTDCKERHAVCKIGKCVCSSPYPVKLDSVHTTCRSESFLETPCRYDEQCLYMANNSECIDQGWCACRQGYGRSPDGQCVNKTGVNARCDTDAECQAFNASCVLSHCTCPSGSVELNGYCVVVDRSMNALHSLAPILRKPWGVALLTLALVVCFCNSEDLMGVC